MEYARVTRRTWSLIRRASRRFSRIDGSQWAAAFSYYAFFSLFPAIVLFVTVASVFVERERATLAIINFINAYLPLGHESQQDIFSSVREVLAARGEASAVAVLVLIWAAMRFFATLIRATNRAWGAEAHRWWRLPFKSLAFLAMSGTVITLALVAPTLVEIITSFFFPTMAFESWAVATATFLLRIAVMFSALSLFYKVAPRRRTRFVEVWAGALWAAVLLQAAGGLFLVYLKNFATFNALYGALGGVMALLLWIYVSGCIFIYGACMCSSRAQVDGPEVVDRSLN